MTAPGSPLYCNPVDNGIGAKYNPLTELGYYGASNPYQDPKRGAIDTVVANCLDAFAFSCDENERTVLEQFDLLQNLEDLVGRSVTLTDVNNNDPNDPQPYGDSCC